MQLNFGVPPELLEFLKLKVAEKEAETKKLQSELKIRDEQISKIELQENNRLEEAIKEKNRLVDLAYERDKSFRIELKQIEDDCQQKLQAE